MIPADQLAQTFQSNHWLALRHLEGLTHSLSLLTLEDHPNPINWVLGHLVHNRNEALHFLGVPSLWHAGEGHLYKTGSGPVDHETALPLERLLADFEEAQADLEMALAQVTDDELLIVVSTRFGERPLWQHLSSLAWHETYHIGQMELRRQYALSGSEPALLEAQPA